jgi:hypothetical protein
MLIKSVVIAVAVAAAAWGILGLDGLRVRPLYCFGVALTIALLLVAVRLTIAPGEPLEQPGESATSGPQPYADLYFLEYRLSWGSVERSRFEQRVRPLLIRVADERLRQRHGVDFHADPASARTIVGEELWQLMTREPITAGKPPSHREVTSWVAAVEEI